MISYPKILARNRKFGHKISMEQLLYIIIQYVLIIEMYIGTLFNATPMKKAPGSPNTLNFICLDNIK